MDTYDVSLSNFRLDEIETYKIDDDYELYNIRGNLHIKCTRNKDSHNHPSLLLHAFDFTFPTHVVSPYCSDEGFSVIWKSRFIYSFHTEKEFTEEKVLITKDDCERIEKWYRRLAIVNENFDLKNPWVYAYNEFIISIDSISVELSYLHLASVLETLLLDGNSELSYRLSLNTAMLVGKDFDERKEIFSVVKQAYDIRSKTTHGDVSALIKVLNKDEVFEKFLEFRKIVVNVMDVTFEVEKSKVISDITNRIFN